MPKEDWGVKRLCPTTGKRFYDLNKNPIVSPYTGETVEMETGRSRMIAADAEDAVTAKSKAAASSDDDTALEADEAEVEVDLGDDVLEDDDEDDSVPLDDIAEVAAEDDDN